MPYLSWCALSLEQGGTSTRGKEKSSNDIYVYKKRDAEGNLERSFDVLAKEFLDVRCFSRAKGNGGLPRSSGSSASRRSWKYRLACAIDTGFLFIGVRWLGAYDLRLFFVLFYVSLPQRYLFSISTFGARGFDFGKLLGRDGFGIAYIRGVSTSTFASLKRPPLYSARNAIRLAGENER